MLRAIGSATMLTIAIGKSVTAKRPLRVPVYELRLDVARPDTDAPERSAA